MNDTLNQPDFILGDSSDAVARLYVRVPREESAAGAILQGQISGPDCRYADTLRTTVKLRDKGPGPTLLAEVAIPEPCYWTPELPFLYRVKVAIEQGNSERLEATAIAKAEMSLSRQIGLRRLGARNRSLFLSGKRYVPRGRFLAAPNEQAVEDAHAAEGAIWTVSPAEQLCEQASEIGVLLVAQMPAELSGSELVAEVRRLARWPAVGVVLLGESEKKRDIVTLRRAAPNLLFAVPFRAELATSDPASDIADLLWLSVESASEHDLAALRNCRWPILVQGVGVASKVLQESEDWTAARRRVDLLQATMAEHGDFAGYFVR